MRYSPLLTHQTPTKRKKEKKEKNKYHTIVLKGARRSELHDLPGD